MDFKTRVDIQQYLNALSKELGTSITDQKFANELDSRDPLAHFRLKFSMPTIGELLEGEEIASGVDVSSECCYLLGHSLGLPPKSVHQHMSKQVENWARRGHRSRWTEDSPINVRHQQLIHEESARIVGAKPIEVAVMNGLSVNIHLGMITFYRPTSSRHKILCEKYPFPSDLFAIESQVIMHGYDPKTSIVYVTPREGEYIWRNEDILKVIEEEGDSIALVHLPGVHYGTGHVFDVKSITEAAHKKGCYVSFDMGHAAGNIELHLHDWDVDVATWCTYKYMNGGAAGLGGFFIHEKYANNFDLPRLTGWWANKPETKFHLNNVLDSLPGAGGFQISTPSTFAMTPLIASLEIFKETSMSELCKKSRLLTGYMQMLLEQKSDEFKSTSTDVPFKIVTSSNPLERGGQLSVWFAKTQEIHDYIKKRGFETDLRGPLMRVTAVPLYNTFNDVLRMYNILCEAIEATATA